MRPLSPKRAWARMATRRRRGVVVVAAEVVEVMRCPQCIFLKACQAERGLRRGRLSASAFTVQCSSRAVAPAEGSAGVAAEAEPELSLRLRCRPLRCHSLAVLRGTPHGRAARPTPRPPTLHPPTSNQPTSNQPAPNPPSSDAHRKCRRRASSASREEERAHRKAASDMWWQVAAAAAATVLVLVQQASSAGRARIVGM